MYRNYIRKWSFFSYVCLEPKIDEKKYVIITQLVSWIVFSIDDDVTIFDNTFGEMIDFAIKSFNTIILVWINKTNNLLTPTKFNS